MGPVTFGTGVVPTAKTSAIAANMDASLDGNNSSVAPSYETTETQRHRETPRPYRRGVSLCLCRSYDLIHTSHYPVVTPRPLRADIKFFGGARRRFRIVKS